MAKTMLFGAAALTAIRLTDGRRANIPAGRAVPENIDPTDAKRLLAEGFLVEVDVVDQVAQLDPADTQPEGPNPPRTRNAVPAGLTADDVARAAAQEAAATAATIASAGGTDLVIETQVSLEPFTDEELAETLKGNVDPILDVVGDNPVKAAQVLAAESEKPEDKRRKTLVAGLQDVIDAAEADAEEAGV